MTRDQLLGALAQLACELAPLSRILGRSPALHKLRDATAPVFLMLTESLAEIDRPQMSPERQARAQRLAALEQQMSEHDPKERQAAIRERLGVRKTAFYQTRLDARALGLIPVDPPQSANSGR